MMSFLQDIALEALGAAIITFLLWGVGVGQWITEHLQ